MTGGGGPHLERIGLVAEYLFAAGLSDEEGLAGELGKGLAKVLPEEDAAGAGPLKRERDFVLEDGCLPSGPSFGGGSLGCYGIWFDTWVGGSAKDNPNAVVNCENGLTPNGLSAIVVNPPGTLPVPHPGPIFTAAPGGMYSCNGVVSKNG